MEQCKPREKIRETRSLPKPVENSWREGRWEWLIEREIVLVSRLSAPSQRKSVNEVTDLFVGVP